MKCDHAFTGVFTDISFQDEVTAWEELQTRAPSHVFLHYGLSSSHAAVKERAHVQLIELLSAETTLNSTLAGIGCCTVNRHLDPGPAGDQDVRR